MKKINLFIALVMWALSASIAGAAGQPLFTVGNLTFSGHAAIDTTSPSNVRGVFVLDQVRNITTSNADYQSNSTDGFEVVGVFKDFDRAFANGPSFGSTGGRVDFYSVAENTFNLSGDFATDTSFVSASDTVHLLGGAGRANTDGFTALGFANATSYLSSGLIDFDSGSLLASFDTNEFLDNTDGAFNLSGTRSTVYSYQGSSDVQAALNPVPVPAASWLFGSAILGVTGLTRRKSG